MSRTNPAGLILSQGTSGFQTFWTRSSPEWQQSGRSSERCGTEQGAKKPKGARTGAGRAAGAAATLAWQKTTTTTKTPKEREASMLLLAGLVVHCRVP